MTDINRGTIVSLDHSLCIVYFLFLLHLKAQHLLSTLLEVYYYRTVTSAAVA
jgi:hypothetical protein